MTPEEQVDEWVNGNPIHNNDRFVHIVDEDDNIIRTEKLEGGECCPDFSCCEPKLLWPVELRQKFKNSDEITRQSMLSMALSQLIALEKLPAMCVSDETDLNQH